MSFNDYVLVKSGQIVNPIIAMDNLIRTVVYVHVYICESITVFPRIKAALD